MIVRAPFREGTLARGRDGTMAAGASFRETRVKSYDRGPGPASAGSAPTVRDDGGDEMSDAGGKPGPGVGDSAPDFTLPATAAAGSKTVRLSDFRGKRNVVLAFFPLAFTPT